MVRNVLSHEEYRALEEFIKKHVETEFPKNRQVYEWRPKAVFVVDGARLTDAEAIAHYINYHKMLGKSVTKTHVNTVINRLGFVFRHVRRDVPLTAAQAEAEQRNDTPPVQPKDEVVRYLASIDDSLKAVLAELRAALTPVEEEAAPDVEVDSEPESLILSQALGLLKAANAKNKLTASQLNAVAVAVARQLEKKQPVSLSCLQDVDRGVKLAVVRTLKPLIIASRGSQKRSGGRRVSPKRDEVDPEKVDVAKLLPVLRARMKAMVENHPFMDGFYEGSSVSKVIGRLAKALVARNSLVSADYEEFGGTPGQRQVVLMNFKRWFYDWYFNTAVAETGV